MVFGPNVISVRLKPIRGMTLIALLAVLLSGCSVGGGSSDTSADATPAPTVAPSPTPVAQLGPVVWTTALEQNGAPAEDLTAFPRNAESIYAVVAVESVSAGEMLTASWALDGVAIDAIDSTVNIDEASASGWVSFSLVWEGETLWPVGTLEIAVSASSGATARGEIQIEST